MALRDRLIFNVKWHRRIGLLCAFFVLILSITGLLLNHTGSLKLDSIKIHSSLIGALYNLPSAKPVTFQVGQQWLSHNGIDNLYLEQTSIAKCSAPLKGALNNNGMLIALCDNELLLLTENGDLLERLTPVYGLPQGSKALAQADDRLLINTDTGVIQTDLDSLEFTPASSPSQVTWLTQKTPPEEIAQFLNDQGPAIDLEQILLDLHSGRLFGSIGVLIMDIAAILLIILSITGVIAWQTSHKMRSGRKKTTR